MLILLGSRNSYSAGFVCGRSLVNNSDCQSSRFPTMLGRPGPTLACLTEQLETPEELSPGIAALREHRRVLTPIVMRERQQRGRPVTCLLGSLIRHLGMSS